MNIENENLSNLTFLIPLLLMIIVGVKEGKIWMVAFALFLGYMLKVSRTHKKLKVFRKRTEQKDKKV